MSFRHTQNRTQSDKSSVQSIEHENDTGVESCGFCSQQFGDINDLISHSHFGMTGHNLSEREQN